jgi:catechol 2,3-dioxygenase-like lactoylglutathione lyase family enzyme
MNFIISGIQQVGIGVPDVEQIWKWYRKYFGIDIKIFEEAAQAPLMTKYTGGQVHSRTATLALSLQGGGGFEIWQYTSRNTQKAAFDIQAGDLGIFITRIKCKNVTKCFEWFTKEKLNIVGALSTAPDGKLHFFVKDPNDNLFEIAEGYDWYADTNHLCGGVAGVILGVSNIENSKKLYSDVLGYNQTLYDQTETFTDLHALNGGHKKFRRVLLTHTESRKGPFSELLGKTTIELLQAYDYSPRKIFENRFWGDWGYIHLCFDIQNMPALKMACENAGFPFVIDSGGNFDMGEAGGHFTYIEDPDGTLIEFVEAYKIPIIKKIGWYLNLRKRNPEKPLPRFMLKALKFNRVKN